MLKKYRENHADFDKGSLNAIGMDPFAAFSSWFDEAVNHGEAEANAFVLSTATAEEGVSSRIVYLKELKDERFVFYTNYLSQKRTANRGTFKSVHVVFLARTSTPIAHRRNR
ncbi:MAG: pyridoxamine 5'-phosphate oxidase family protein [Crocinitomicaceae bacterium]|nr:pyridoxamine 5'-phosphate oxidase family protein [Crocinitomicaceae bacterium]